MKTKKSKLGLGIFIGVLIGLIIGLSGFIVYDKFIRNDDNKVIDHDKDSTEIKSDKEDKKSENSDNENINNLEIDSSIVKELSNKIIGIYTDHLTSSMYSNYFYEKTKTTLSEENITFRLSLSAEMMFRENSNVIKDNCVNEEDIKKAYIELFGNTDGYSRNDFYIGNVLYTWSDIKNCYEGKIYSGANSYGYKVLSKLGYAKQVISNQMDIIELYEYFAVEDPSSSATSINYYSDYERKQLIVQKEKSDSYSQDDLFNQFAEKLGLYKYVFRKNEDNHYVFVSVERLK